MIMGYAHMHSIQLSSNIRCCRAFLLLEIGLPLPARYDRVGNNIIIIYSQDTVIDNIIAILYECEMCAV